MSEKKFFHAVTLDEEKCKGCINCIKRCPTQAIRVRNGKAHIITERCIDCGECIRVCPHHAKKAVYDSLDSFKEYKYIIALPAPSLYGQFNNIYDASPVLEALLAYGFDQVYEVSKAAEMVSDITRKLMEKGELRKPLISSACPTIVRLIRVRFPQLLDNILKINPPVEVAARIAKKKAMETTGFSEKEICTVFISPCPAKMTSVKMPLGTKKSYIDKVIAISDIYPKLLEFIKSPISEKVNQESGKIGVSWASSGGESAAILNDNYLAADGIENVIQVLESIEDQKFRDLDFIELNACPAGCVGGVLTVENPYIARVKLKKLRKYLQITGAPQLEYIPKELMFNQKVDFEPILKLSDNMAEAFLMMQEMEKIVVDLPGLDCGSCGAPTCKDLAEDIVRGFATIEDCIVKYRLEQQKDTIEQ